MVPALNIFLQLLGGAITAVLSVILAIWFRDSWREVRALRALKTELENNREIAKETIPDIAEMAFRRNKAENQRKMSKRFRPPDVDPVPVSFRTSAFDNLKESGSTLGLSQPHHKTLSEHYRWVNSANELLTQRERMRSSILSEDDIYQHNVRVLEYERAFVDQSLRTCSEEMYESILMRVRGKTKHWITHHLVEDESVYDSVADFEAAIDAVSKELEKHTIVTRLV